MRRRALGMGALAIAAVALLLGGPPAEGDTFTHKETGQALKGRLLGTVSEDGKTILVVRTDEGDGRLLPAAEWEVTPERSEHPKPPER